MSTFIGQLVGFAVIVWLFLKFVRPPLSRMMAKQQEDIREALADSATAAETLANADQAHIKAVEDARAEAVHVTDEARQDSVKIAAQLRDQAASEADRIKAQGAQQVQLLRQQAIRGLRAELGTESVQQAESLVRAHVADPEARAETVDRFLAELEAMVAAGTTSSAAAELGAPLKLRAASREGLTAVVRKFDQVSSGLGVDELGTLADDLTAVAKLLHREPALAKHLGTQGQWSRLRARRDRRCATLVGRTGCGRCPAARRTAGAAGAGRPVPRRRGGRGSAVPVRPHP